MLEEKQLVLTEQPPQTLPASRRPAFRRSRWSLVASTLAAVLVLSLITTWFVQTHSSPGHPGPGATTFNDTGAISLGAPLYTFQINQPASQGNQSPSTSSARFPAGQPEFDQWSADGRFYSSLQLNAQGNELQVHVLNMASGKTTIYPVLDSSWIPAKQLQYSFYLVNNDIVAIRPQGTNSATMVIWDITGHRQLTKQTVPTSHDQSGAILPVVIPSQAGHKFALYEPGHSLTIWDAVTGQQLATCQGVAPASNGEGQIEWYNNDQNILFSDLHGQLVVDNANTGKTLFEHNDATKSYYQIVFSPNNKYLALETGPQNTPPNVISDPVNVEILDALTGNTLHTSQPVITWASAFMFGWLPDSQHLRADYPGPSIHQYQIRIWDAFTDRESLNRTVPANQFEGFTRDSRYLILGNADSTSLELLRTSDGKITMIATPNYAPGYTPNLNSMPLIIENEDIILLQHNAMYVWNISTGQLLFKYHGPLFNDVPGYPIPAQFVSFVSLSPDSRYLVLVLQIDTNSRATIDIWSLKP